MKKIRMALVALLLFFALTAMVKTPVCAANTTVTGTVGKETKADLLYLGTSGGTMQIKIDSGTDLSECKVILPGTALSVEVYYGSDAYMHAAKIKGGVVGPQATIDTANTTNVTGTISEGTTSDLIYLATSGGTMQIKLDTTTDTSGCRVIMLGKSVQISVARGSDAYMHALTITDISSGTSYSSSAVSSGNYAGLPTASGTISSDSSMSAVYLGSTKYVIDPDTDFTSCKAYFVGRSATVTYYKGIDGVLHAARIVDVSPSSNATVSNSVMATVTGKVTGDSRDSVIYLSTDGGTMQIKLDTSTNTDSCGALYAGKTVKISVAHGSDEYLHALTVTDR
ncbi:MAG: hypothetical protein K6G16_07025 [Lachnospiraceae bacterium]|nr:hypothetical protein [Lachnospiraceae bacterium]